MDETKIKFLKFRLSHLVNGLHLDDNVFLSQSFVGEMSRKPCLLTQRVVGGGVHSSALALPLPGSLQALFLAWCQVLGLGSASVGKQAPSGTLSGRAAEGGHSPVSCVPLDPQETPGLALKLLQARASLACLWTRQHKVRDQCLRPVANLPCHREGRGVVFSTPFCSGRLTVGSVAR